MSRGLGFKAAILRVLDRWTSTSQTCCTPTGITFGEWDYKLVSLYNQVPNGIYTSKMKLRRHAPRYRARVAGDVLVWQTDTYMWLALQEGPEIQERENVVDLLATS